MPQAIAVTTAAMIASCRGCGVLPWTVVSVNRAMPVDTQNSSATRAEKAAPIVTTVGRSPS
jgi:hypothetical protein